MSEMPYLRAVIFAWGSAQEMSDIGHRPTRAFCSLPAS